MGFIERKGKIGEAFHTFNKWLLIGEGAVAFVTGLLGLAALHLAATGAFVLDAAGSPAAESVVLKN